VSQKKSIVVVGTGSIGERHLRCLLATGRAEVSICEVNPSLRAVMAERYPVKNVFDAYDAAVASRPDAVVICTPAHLHVSLAAQAAKNGVHVLIEKPLSTTLAGVDELQREVADRQLVSAVAYVCAHPALAAMRAAIHSGRLGEPVQIVAVAGQNFPFYRPAYRATYYRDRKTGGGAVQDALTHVINAAEWLVGPTESLVADLDHLLLEGVAVEDIVHVLTRHGKVMGCFSLNQHQAPNENTITVICQGGTARFEYHNCRWRCSAEPSGDWHDEPVGPLERDTLFLRQADAFLDALLAQGAPLCSLAEAAQTLRANLAILTSAQRRSWERVVQEDQVHA
jgi:predicted dehydrogenase